MKDQGSNKFFHETKATSPLLTGLPPFIPSYPRVLILGSMPSEASLKQGFYYAHPQNRFFKLLSLFLSKELCDLNSRQMALEYCHIALFDVIKSCRREGSLDSAIHDAIPNDLHSFLQEHSSISCIATNGGLAKKLFLREWKRIIQNLQEHLDLEQERQRILKIKIVNLPSTSPANARFTIQKLKEYYFEIFAYALST